MSNVSQEDRDLAEVIDKQLDYFVDAMIKGLGAHVIVISAAVPSKDGDLLAMAAGTSKGMQNQIRATHDNPVDMDKAEKTAKVKTMYRTFSRFIDDISDGSLELRIVAAETGKTVIGPDEGDGTEVPRGEGDG